MELIKSLDRNDLIYTPCYCEENIYKLCEYFDQIPYESTASTTLLHAPSLSFHVVFVSNPARTVVLLNQSKSSRDDGGVVWDYHCVLVIKEQKIGGEAVVLDFDTRLGLVTPFVEWVGRTFSPVVREQFQARFRVVDGAEYLRVFFSDRQHMIDERTGLFRVDPPVYEAIRPRSSGNEGGGEGVPLTEFWALGNDALESRGPGFVCGEVVTFVKWGVEL